MSLHLTWIDSTLLSMVLFPLMGSALAGLMRHQLGRRGAHTVTILGVSLSFIAALLCFKWAAVEGMLPYQVTFYTWAASDHLVFPMGFLLDPLSAVMGVVVTGIALLVHIYSIGYMHDDDGYQRFFSYMSLFTFAMLVLVYSDNLLGLFFGWEGVGLVSYLLIGFWFKRNSAAAGSLKAFLVNRVGDFGFLLGMVLLLSVTGTLQYLNIFKQAPTLAGRFFNITDQWTVHLLTVVNTLLFVGAMGKSAQIPLHVWLPESMEGPTPISALIHAATMVTAGVYMIARLSPLYVLSTPVLTLILTVGSTGALLLGMVGVVQSDIKRVIAYSTLSQLGYMIAATGTSFAAIGMFHLITHAFFKALLFLGAGSVIVALHHEQDLNKMGNLRRYMPMTYWTFLVGVLSLSAFPPFSGFYSKDAIIAAVRASTIPGARYAYMCLLAGAFVTALYSFRVFFLAFHGEEKLAHPESVKEQYYSITIPLIILAVPSAIVGMGLAGTMLYANPGFWRGSITVTASHAASLALLGQAYEGWLHAAIESLKTLPFWFSVSGAFVAWLCYSRYPQLPNWLSRRFSWLYCILIHQYGFNAFNERVLVPVICRASDVLYEKLDMAFIDNRLVNGIGRRFSWLSGQLKRLHSGYLYHYALVLMLGMVASFVWLMTAF